MDSEPNGEVEGQSEDASLLGGSGRGKKQKKEKEKKKFDISLPAQHLVSYS